MIEKHCTVTSHHSTTAPEGSADFVIFYLLKYFQYMINKYCKIFWFLLTIFSFVLRFAAAKTIIEAFFALVENAVHFFQKTINIILKCLVSTISQLFLEMSFLPALADNTLLDLQLITNYYYLFNIYSASSNNLLFITQYRGCNTANQRSWFQDSVWKGGDID